MSKFALANAALLTALLTLPNAKTDNTEALYDATAVKTKAAVSCTPDRSAIAQLLAEVD
jgi:hypothetical protein